MSQSHESSGFSPGNFLWAALSLGVVIIAALSLTRSVSPETDIEAKRGERRLEVRKKINAEESSKLGALAWADKAAGTVKAPIEFASALTIKELSAKKSAASAIKVEAPLVLPPGDSPAMPSAPSGATTIQFPKLGAPAPAPAPAPAVGN